MTSNIIKKKVMIFFFFYVVRELAVLRTYNNKSRCTTDIVQKFTKHRGEKKNFTVWCEDFNTYIDRLIQTSHIDRVEKEKRSDPTDKWLILHYVCCTLLVFVHFLLLLLSLFFFFCLSTYEQQKGMENPYQHICSMFTGRMCWLENFILCFLKNA